MTDPEPQPLAGQIMLTFHEHTHVFSRLQDHLLLDHTQPRRRFIRRLSEELQSSADSRNGFVICNRPEMHCNSQF